ncbi:hypothetical protein QCE83_34350 [Caballeronia sp. LZ034LL]|nr:hypothetical protein [Caballeronia sp. LZ034LL]
MPFTISAAEGRWPNRIYFEVMPGSVLYQYLPKEEYIDWLYEAVQSDETVAAEMSKIAEAIMDGKQMVRIIVPDRFNDYRGQAVLALLKQAIQTNS